MRPSLEKEQAQLNFEEECRASEAQRRARLAKGSQEHEMRQFVFTTHLYHVSITEVVRVKKPQHGKVTVRGASAA